MNYSEHLFRVSSLNHIMAGAVYGRDLYEEAKTKYLLTFGKLEKYKADLDLIKNKESKTAIAKLDQIDATDDLYTKQKDVAEMLQKRINHVDISDGCKTHLLDIWIAKEFGRVTKDIKNKYIQKGLEVEDAAIVMYSVYTGTVHDKNIERRDDGFIMGEIDFDDEEIVYDVKSSWDIFTFFKNIKYFKDPTSSPYYWQMQGYMKLWNKKKSKLVYSLIDTPQKLIDKEKKYLAADFIGTDAMLEEAYAELELNMKYSDIEIDKRIIEIDIERNDDDIAKIELVVKACRTYLDGLESTIYSKNRKYEMDKN